MECFQVEKKLDQNLKLAQELIAIGSLILILVSSTIYYFEKKVEYKKHFSVWKFIFGNKKCKNSTPSKAKFFNMIRKNYQSCRVKGTAITSHLWNDPEVLRLFRPQSNIKTGKL